MRLALKLVAYLILGLIPILLVDGWLTVRYEREAFRTEASNEARRLGRAVSGPLSEVARLASPERAVQLLTEASEPTARLDWTWRMEPASGSGAGGSTVEADFESATLTTAPDGTPCVTSRIPITLPGERRQGLLAMSVPLADLELRTDRVIMKVFVLAGAMAGVAVLLALTLGIWLVGRPLQALMEQTRRIAAGSLEERVAIGGRDELHELGLAMNRMSADLAAAREAAQRETDERLKTLNQLRHADRLTTVGSMASGIAHELGTPLNVISGRAELLAGGTLLGDDALESARIIKQQADRIAGIVRQLLDFARRHSPERKVQDIRTIISETLSLMAPLAQKGGCRLEHPDVQTACTADVDGAQLQQVLANLLSNAVQSMPDGGTIGVDVRNEQGRPPEDPEAELRSCLAISVKDEGCGIAPGDLERVFDPFFTTKDVGQGTGMGLSVAYGIMREHGGWISVQSTVGQGSTFTVWLPGVGSGEPS